MNEILQAYAQNRGLSAPPDSGSCSEPNAWAALYGEMITEAILECDTQGSCFEEIGSFNSLVDDLLSMSPLDFASQNNPIISAT